MAIFNNVKIRMVVLNTFIGKIKKELELAVGIDGIEPYFLSP